MISLDSHTHSIASGHGTTSMIHQMAESASKKELKILCVTDHGPATLGSAKESYFRNLKYASKERYGVKILYGCETNILDYFGAVDLPQNILKTLDYNLAGFHIQNLKPGSVSENTKALLHVMDNPYIHTIAHPDDVKYPLNYKVIVEHAVDTHTLLELNETSLSLNGYRGNTTPNSIELLKWCAHYNHPIVLGSDSHGIHKIGQFKYCLELLNQIHFPKELILNTNEHFFLNFIKQKTTHV